MSVGYSEIDYVKFSVADSDDNIRTGVTEIINYDLFNGRFPVEGGAYDARMGTTDHYYTCSTCGHQRKNCVGHPGYLKLKTPIQQPTMISEIRKWLRVICLECGSAMVDPAKYAKISPLKRLNEASNVQVEGKKCPTCTAVHPKISRDPEDHFSLWIEYPSAAGAQHTQKLHIFRIKQIFNKISPDLVKALGRKQDTHPNKFILDVIQIPPPAIRPGMKSGLKTQGYHDVNNMIQYIIKANQAFPEQLPLNFGGNGPSVSNNTLKELDRSSQNLQQLYYDFIQGSAATSLIQGSSGKRAILSGTRPASAILRRFPRKEGRIRKNLLGCQVWSISRSTISGNNDLKLDEVGFPQAFARVLQVAESVQEYNIKRLTPFFLNGRTAYPGSTRIWKQSTNALHDVEGMKRNFYLEIGDILYRDIVDGDYAFFNRQPSLERSSIGVHRIVILDDPKISTFQMNVCACNLYNADFDGDQMNLWIPHSIMSRAEAQFMCHILNWFISTKSSGPMNGQVQDSTVGNFMLTKNTHAGKPNVMDKFHAMAMFQTTQTDPPMFDKQTYSGREIVSMLLKQTPINYNKSSKWYSEIYSPYIHYDKMDIVTQIKNGELVSGVLDKKAIGSGALGGVYHQISRIYGPSLALDSIFAMQHLSINYLGNIGFTIGLSDMILNQKSLNQVHQIISETLQESQEINRRLLDGKIIPPIGLTTHQFYEKLQQNSLQIPDRILGPILQSIDPETNGLFLMIASGGKGSNPNMIHIMANVGQIELNTKRIQNTFGFGRTLVYYPRFDLSAESTGFIKNSYIAGLTAPEFIYGQMNGRFDLINKALSTSSTGYANRKAIFALQSCITDYYRHVSINNKIVQMIYGEDGLDARQIEAVKFKTVFLSDAKFVKEYKYSVASDYPEATAVMQKLFDEIYESIAHDRKEYIDMQFCFASINFNKQITDIAQLPVHVERIVETMVPSEKPDLDTFINMNKSVIEFCRKLPYVLINEIQMRLNTPIPSWLQRATTLIQMLVRIELQPKILLQFTPEQLAYCFNVIRMQYSISLVDPGEAVGILAAQSVSEPLTQYMLDSHHRSISGGTNKSGIVRPQEIFGAKPVESEQSSEMLLWTTETDQIQVQEIANNIEKMILKRFIKQWSLLFEEFHTPSSLKYPGFDDAEWIQAFAKNHPLITKPMDLTNWCLRIELSKTSMILKSMTLAQIIEVLRMRYPYTYIVHTSENVSQIILRIYFLLGVFRQVKNINEEKTITATVDVIINTLIRGISKIRNANVVKISKSVIEGGEIVRKDVYAIKTIGTNIFGVALNSYIDSYNIVSTSVGDTYKMYGIEAARQKIISEIRCVMGDRSPSHRHLMLYADVMTRTGRITSLERDGLNIREHKNVLQRAGMSAPRQVLVSSALESINNPVYGVAAPMILGSVPQIGTLYSDVIIHEEFVKKHTKSIDSVLDSL